MDADTATVIEAAFDRLVDNGDSGPLSEILASDVTWGDCAGRDQVIRFVDRLLSQDLAVSASAFDIAGDRLVISFTIALITKGKDSAQHDQGSGVFLAVFVDDDGRVTEICDAASTAEARHLKPIGSLVDGAARPVELQEVAPVLPVGDLPAAVTHYRLLGFDVRAYEGDALYAFAEWGSVNLHLAAVADLDPALTTSAVYLYVNDADALFARWRKCGAAGRFVAPADTDYGLREGAHVDPDGNLLRFGSPLPA